MSNQRVGVLFVGVGGAIASTVIGGVALVNRELSGRDGMLTETGTVSTPEGPRLIKDLLQLARLEDLEFGGWDVQPADAYAAAREAKVIRSELLEQARPELERIRPWPGLYSTTHLPSFAGAHTLSEGDLETRAATIRENIRRFRDERGVDEVVVVNSASTEASANLDSETLADPDAFKRGLKRSDQAISPSMVYLFAAISEGAAHVNFTPSVAEVPALTELARSEGVPYAGRDGKTGQTLLKTVLAPAFRARQLRVEGWFSTNILGNRDGLVLADPSCRESKILSKRSVLDEILGYEVGSGSDKPNHQVHIHYYPPRGDAKEAWDSVDLRGFLEARMQLKVNFLCRDSILAAPLVIDLARLAARARSRGERGVMTPASLFFKYPLTEGDDRPVHDFFAQYAMFEEYVAAASSDDA